MGASSSHQSSNPVDMTPPAFKSLQQPFADTLQNTLTQYNNSPDTSKLVNGYQGPMAAPITNGESTGLSQVQGLASNIGNGNSSNVNTPLAQFANNNTIANGSSTGAIANYAQTLMGANQNPTSSQTASGYMGNLNGASGGVYNPNGNPFLSSAITAAQRPTMDNLTETLTRDNPSMFVANGQFTQPNGSSAFDRANAIATRGAANAMGDIATNMGYQNYNDAANRSATALNQFTQGQQQANLQTQQETANQQQNAVQNAQTAQTSNNQGATTASGVQGTDINNAISNLQAQALPRLISDQGIQNGMDAFNNNINSVLSGLGMVSGASRPVISQQSSGSSGGFNLK